MLKTPQILTFEKLEAEYDWNLCVKNLIDNQNNAQIDLYSDILALMSEMQMKRLYSLNVSQSQALFLVVTIFFLHLFDSCICPLKANDFWVL